MIAIVCLWLGRRLAWDVRDVSAEIATNEDGSIKVEFSHVATERVQMSMWTNDRLNSAEKMENYAKGRMTKGKLDCS